MVADGTADPSFLSALSEREFEQLSARATKRRFATGAFLFHEGDPSDRLVLIRTGRVKVSYLTTDGREVVLAVRGAGDLLGELSAIDGEPRSASASALEQVEALLIPAQAFLDFVKEHPAVAVALLKLLSRRLRDADRKRIEFAAYDSVGRVARRLVELADRFGEGSDDGLRITLPLSQQELAGWVGASREAVSKALHVLRARGFIETARRGITVLDLEALRKRAH